MLQRFLYGSWILLFLPGCLSLFDAERQASSGSITPANHAAAGEQRSTPAAAPERAAEPSQPRSQVRQPDAMTTEELELKMAKMWARVDQLELRVMQQEERLSLLQQGLTLGLVPEKLKRFQNNQKALQQPADETIETPESPTSSINLEDDLAELAPVAEPPVAQRQTKSRYSDSDFRRLIRDAQGLFNQGKYGQAIAAYQQIHKDFPDRTEHGQHLFWIGLSWYYLKEDKFAVENLRQLTEQFPSSPWLGKARFYLAKIDLRQGYRQKALSQFKQLIEDFQGKDIEEMARFEVQQLEETL